MAQPHRGEGPWTSLIQPVAGGRSITWPQPAARDLAAEEGIYCHRSPAAKLLDPGAEY